MKKQVIVFAVCGLLLGLVAAPALAQSAPEVGIDTQAYITSKSIGYDADKDGLVETAESMGTFDVYSVPSAFSFHWTPISGATYYRVSLIQYAPPGVGPSGVSTEVKVGHHSASDPNGPKFTMSLGDGQVCLDCVTVIQVVPETMTIGANGVYVYSTLPGKLVSGSFVFESPVSSRSGSGVGSVHPVCGNGVCSAGEDDIAGVFYCPADCP